ncbi:hypothetical protein RHIZ404_200012 [Rhizobium sp. EC-SD404]|nr:hypothetical protein RHIZ404_200012 [Rhizobium sp. EC-SD404]
MLAAHRLHLDRSSVDSVELAIVSVELAIVSVELAIVVKPPQGSRRQSLCVALGRHLDRTV